jgi:DNA-binding Xre family transcriptional regulator
MKISEVPQDKGYLIEGRISDLTYVVDGEGHYTSTQSIGWKPKNEAMKLAWDQVYEHAEEIKKQILEGKSSPIALYMELNVMDVGILAAYMGISKRKVRRHLKMEEFRKLPENIINRYAEVLNLTPGELVDIERIRNTNYEG